MARSIAFLSISFPLWLVMTGTASGQAAVEAGLGAANAGTTAAPMAGLGKALSRIAGTPDKTISPSRKDSAGSPARSTARTVSRPAASKPAARPEWEDPDGIQTGLSYAELVRRFGPPAMAITGDLGTSLIYSGKAGTFQLELRDDKVASIEKPKS